MYEFLLAVHILCAVLWVGGGVTLHILGRRALAEGTAQAAANTEQTGWVGPKFYAPLSVILLVAGILLVDEAGYQHSDLFITLGYTGWFAAFVIGAGVYPRLGKRIGEAVEAHGVESAETRRAVTRFFNVQSLEIAILVLVIVDMSVKPGL